MADADVIAFLKANKLYDAYAIAAGVAAKADPGVGDVHVSTTVGRSKRPPATVAQPKPEPDPDAIAEPAAAAVAKAIAEADVVFFKGEANLYVSRPLKAESAQRLYDWAKEQGIPNIVPPELMHVTQVHSTAEVDTDKFQPQSTLVTVGPDRWLSQLGKGNALVMFFLSDELTGRFQEAMAAGASWDFPMFMPHMTISYDTSPVDAHLYGMQAAPLFPIMLGPEVFAASNDDWAAENGLTKGDDDFEALGGKFTITKALDEKQMIFGWFSVTHIDGQLVVDKQDDAILLQDTVLPGSTQISKGLESAVYDYVLYSRQHGDMHEEIGTGNLVESMVYTAEKAALGHNATNENGQQLFGWWGGFKVENDVWKRYKDGQLPEFSIGGRGTRVAIPSG